MVLGDDGAVRWLVNKVAEEFGTGLTMKLGSGKFVLSCVIGFVVLNRIPFTVDVRAFG